MHYDFAITSASPVGPGCGDQGAYVHRLLAALSGAGLRCAAFVGTPPSAETAAGLPAVRFVRFDPQRTPQIARERSEEMLCSHELCLALLGFLRENTVDVVEFPDAGAEGFHFVQHNLVHRLVPTTLVRLHGPSFVRDDARGSRLCTQRDALLYAAELETIQFADHVIHAGGPLLDRVLDAFLPAQAAAIRARALRVPRPPLPEPAPPGPRAPSPNLRLLFPGALSHLDGADLFVLNALRHLAAAPGSPWTFVCAGGDTAAADGGSFLAYLRSLVPPAHAGRFVFETGADPGQRRTLFAQADAFVLPSRFASHPAVLGEILAQRKPLALSVHVDADASVLRRPEVAVFDPEIASEWERVWCRTSAGETGDAHAASGKDDPAAAYASLPKIARPAPPPAAMTVVIPHYQDTDNLAGLLDRLHADPDAARVEIVVVDDCSPPASQTALHALRARHPGVSWMSTAHPRSGPLAARALGTSAASRDIVAFVDSDDYIDVSRYLAYAGTLAASSELDAILPSMRCFGLENSIWLPLPKARFTVPYMGFAHAGLIGRKDRLLRAFAHALPSAEHIAHAEDCLFSMSLLFGGARIACLSEIAYHYNRSNGQTRSQTNAGSVWRSRHLRERHCAKCLGEALAGGSLTALDLRLLQKFALGLPPEHSAMTIRRASNRVAWHTHLYRAVRSLLGDSRYRP